MKTLLIVFLFIVSLVSIQAQNKISYAYDASGNRTERILVVATKSLLAGEEPENIITEEIAKREVKIYSSIQGQITVEISTLEGMKTGTMTIYAFPNGNTVLTRKVKYTREDLDISNQRAGIYILLVDIDGEKTSYKLMKN
ncbi:hypothetical protein FACS1894179_04040 [Bacteroidia bacterium]|nr:hypothetical protein FACS1894179_04040 [Bacteroidia bacterium]